jgi:hypothetical protein
LSSGIVLKGDCGKWLVEANTILASAFHDIYEENNATAASGGHHIKDNVIVRTNSDYNSIFISLASSTECTKISGNRLTGFDRSVTTTRGINVLLSANTSKRVIITDNWFANYYDGVAFDGTLSGRVFDRYYVDRNHFENCENGFVASGTDAVLIGESNTYVNCATFVRSTAAYVGARNSTNIVLPPRAAAPTAGTWIVGDRAVGPGVIGSPKAWTVTTAGTPGTWTSEGNL